ncbi:MAG: hypothetical protein KF751_16735 [Nitrospira sp.]|uniref:hypothetical protein n=1 Tax=Nitrospira sp. BLG_1 TaxID=3395883 RepID=UPI001D8BDDAB|nr:hypothetical protein [Nitrospira sp.]
MRTSLWVSVGWLLLLLVVSLSAEKNSVGQQAAVGAATGQSSCLTPVSSPAHDIALRSNVKPGGRCEALAPASPLGPPACQQEAFVQPKQTIALSQRNPVAQPLRLKGDRRHGQADDRGNTRSVTVLADRRI